MRIVGGSEGRFSALRITRFVGLAALVAAFARCASDGGMEPPPPDTTPAAVEIVSGGGQRALVGTQLPAPLRVRVRNAAAASLSGVTVSFSVLSGSATLDPTSATTDNQGTAQSVVTLGAVGGPIGIQATAGSATADITATALAPTTIEVAAGDGQSVPITGTLVNPLEARVRDQAGDPLPGVTVDWSISAEAGPGAALSSPTATTNSSGLAINTLTVGSVEGVYEVTAAFTDLAGSPAVFSSMATLAPAISSVAPSPARESFTATLTGLNFGAAAGDNVVTVDGATAVVNSAAGGTTLEITLPETACLPARDDASFVVSVGGVSGPNFAHPTLPRDSSAALLGVSQTDIRADSAAVECVQFPARGGPSSYLVVSAVTTGTSGVNVAERLTQTTGSATIFGEAGFSQLPGLTEPRRASVSGVDASLEAQSAFDAQLRALEAELIRAHAAEARAAFGASAMGAGRIAGAAAAAVGDTIELQVVEVETGCSTADTIAAVVKAIGSHSIAVEDTAAPAGGFTTTDYEEIVAEFDAKTFITDTTYFGSPSDLDANDATFLVFTPEVNKFSPPGASSIILGFFFAGDLFPTASCPGSNEGEYFYSLAADPAGDFGNVFSTAFVRQISRGTAAHEYQHLINAAQRIFVTGGPPEDTWLNEGLSHLAEEVVGHAVTGLAPDMNLDFATANAVPADYDGYYRLNFGRLRQYLVDSAPQSPIDADADLPTRGAIWSFLRWILDQEATPATESDLTRALVITDRTGVDNLESVVGKPLEELLPEWLLSLYADDFVPGVEGRITLPSWDLRDIYTSGPPGGYPLVPTAFGYADGTFDFSVVSGSGRFFLLSSGAASPAMSTRFTTPGGAPLDPNFLPRVLLLRLP